MYVRMYVRMYVPLGESSILVTRTFEEPLIPEPSVGPALGYTERGLRWVVHFPSEYIAKIFRDRDRDRDRDYSRTDRED